MKVKARFVLFLVVPAILVLFACSKRSDTSHPAANRLQFQVNETELSMSSQKVIQNYTQNLPLEPALLRDAIYSNHLAIYEKNPRAALLKNADLESFVQDIGKNASDSALDLKPYYESRLADIFKAPSDYFVNAVTLADIKESNALQCYSGTLLYAVEALAHLSDPFNRNLVVIIESGHMLMGRMERQGNDWALYGIETTASGKAQVNYGLFKDMSSQIRVVELEHFLLIEAAKYGLKNGMEVSNQALRLAGNKYGATELLLLTSEPEITLTANYSPLAFGVADQPQHRKPRAQFDIVVRSALPDYVPAGIPVLRAKNRDEVKFFGGMPYGAGGAPIFSLSSELNQLRQEAQLNNRSALVIKDKAKYGLSSVSGEVTLDKACSIFLEELDWPGELSPSRMNQMKSFLKDYSRPSTGEQPYGFNPNPSEVPYGPYPGAVYDR